MRTSRSIFILFTCAACAIVTQSWRWARAESALAHAQRLHDAGMAEIEELLALRAKAPPVLSVPDAPADLLTHVREAMDRAGIATDRLRESAPSGTRAVKNGAGESDLREQGMRVVLEPMHLGEVGDLLVERSRLQSAWRVSSIELVRGNRAATDARYRVVLSLSTLYKPRASP